MSEVRRRGEVCELSQLRARTSQLCSSAESLSQLQLDFEKWLEIVNQVEQELSSLMNKIEEAASGQRPLKLLLFGGTGVGKSSILNARAEQKLSSVSHVERAHTSTFTLYIHERWRPLFTDDAEF